MKGDTRSLDSGSYTLCSGFRAEGEVPGTSFNGRLSSALCAFRGMLIRFRNSLVLEGHTYAYDGTDADL